MEGRAEGGEGVRNGLAVNEIARPSLRDYLHMRGWTKDQAPIFLGSS